MVIFNLFCIKIQFYYSKNIHTLFMHKNKNANVTTKSRMCIGILKLLLYEWVISLKQIEMKSSEKEYVDNVQKYI